MPAMRVSPHAGGRQRPRRGDRCRFARAKAYLPLDKRPPSVLATSPSATGASGARCDSDARVT